MSVFMVSTLSITKRGPMQKKLWLYIGGGIAVVLVAIQLVPAPPMTNPPVEEEMAAPENVLGVLQRSCYDCHSYQTEWPWYARVAPMKWLVRNHVENARSDLNFTAWNRVSAEDRPHTLEEIAEEVEEAEMPKPSYLRIHRDARLTDEERQLLIDWALSEAARLEREGAAGPPPDELLELEGGGNR